MIDRSVQCVNCSSTNIDAIRVTNWRRPNGDKAWLYLCNDCDCEWEE